MTTGIINIPKYWPFSRFGKSAVIGSLPVVKNGNFKEQKYILELIEKRLKHKGVYRISIKSYDSSGSKRVLKSLSYGLRDRYEFYLDLTIPIDRLWSKLKATRRNKIRKALKNGIQTAIENTATGVEYLYQFIEESMTRRGIQYKTDEITKEITLKLIKNDRAVLFLSTSNEGFPINAALFSKVGNRAYYLESGTSSKGNIVAGPVHLIWTAIEFFQNKEVKVLNLGGADVPKGKKDPAYGLFRFKRDYGAEIILQPSGKKIISKFGSNLNLLKDSIKKVA